MEPIHIRPAGAKEPRLKQLAVAMHHESARRHLTWAADEVALELVYHSTQPDTHCGFVAEAADQLIGFIGGSVKRFEFSAQSRLCSTFVYVTPEYRGTRAFPKLLNAFESWALAHAVPYVEIGMSGGVNTPRLQRMFERIGYKRIGNVLAHRPQTFSQAVIASTQLRSRPVAADEASHWEPSIREAHGHSALAPVPFDAASYRSTFEALATSRGARLYELLERNRSIGLYGMRLQKIAMCKSLALKCVLVVGARDSTVPRVSLLRAVSDKLPQFQAACGAHELFWLTRGARNPDAVERILRPAGYWNLGGTFIRQIDLSKVET